MTGLRRPEVLAALTAMRDDVQRQVAALDRYRAIKSLEQTIEEFPALEDLTRALGEIRERVQRQLDETREFRALSAIDRILPELAGVFDLLNAQRSDDAVGAVTQNSVQEMAQPEAEVIVETVAAQSSAVSATGFEAVAYGVSGATPHETGQAVPPAMPDSDETAPQRQTQATTKAAESLSLADSVALLMAQGIASPPHDTHPPDSQLPERGEKPALAPAERAA